MDACSDGAELAAVDLGSNSFRLAVARLDGGAYRRVDERRETVRLGAGLGADGRLDAASMRRALACLARFAERLVPLDPARVRAVATQALREARNRDAFLARAERALGRPIEVISGDEEARLTWLGVARLEPSRRRRLIVDIGGGSTELVLGGAAGPRRAASFAVGSVQLSRAHFADGRLDAARFRAARRAARVALAPGVATFGPAHWSEALGAAGTVGAAADVLAASGFDAGTITPAGLRWCVRQCLRAGHVGRLALPGLHPDRRPVLAGGLALLDALMAQYGVAALRPARGALRHGVIFELAARLGR